MTLEINGTDYTPLFGIGFIRALDEKYCITSSNGTKFGAGMETVVPKLMSYDALTLSEILYEGFCTEKKRPTQKDIDAYIDNAEDIEQLFADVLDELKKSNATKLKMKNILEATGQVK